MCNCGKVDCPHCGNTVDRSDVPVGQHLETCENCQKPFGYEIGGEAAEEPPEQVVYNNE